MNDFCTVKSKKELSCILEKDKNACFGSNKVTLEKKLRNPFKHKLFAFFKLLRKYEYLCFKRDSCKNKILSKYYSLKIKFFDIYEILKSVCNYYKKRIDCIKFDVQTVLALDREVKEFTINLIEDKYVTIC